VGDLYGKISDQGLDSTTKHGEVRTKKTKHWYYSIQNEQASLINRLLYGQKFVGYLFCFSIFLLWLYNLLGEYSSSVFASFWQNLKVKFKLKVFFGENVFPSLKKVCKFCTYHPIQNPSLAPAHLGHTNTHKYGPQVNQSERTKLLSHIIITPYPAKGDVIILKLA